jgi:hypothetical protein
MNWEEKLVALQHCGDRPHARRLLRVTVPGHWVCELPGLSSNPDKIAFSTVLGIGGSPQEAVENAWYLATGPAVNLLLVSDQDGAPNRVVHWSEPSQSFEPYPAPTVAAVEHATTVALATRTPPMPNGSR